jgi:putative two-component system response regulator
MADGRKSRILIVDDDSNLLRMLEIGLKRFGYDVLTADSAKKAGEVFGLKRPDCIIADYNMSGASGLELLAEVRKTDAEIPFLILTGHGSEDLAVKATGAGANGYLKKPITPSELNNVLKPNIELYELHKRINRELSTFYNVLVNLIEGKDAYTAGHSQRVGKYAGEIAEAMGLSPEQRRNISCGSMIHDIGKIGIPDAILNKPGKLTDEEFAKIKEHPMTGQKMIDSYEALSPLFPLVKHHHERFDGRGYPTGLRGEEIPIGAAVIAAADSIDAMTSNRSYRDAQDWSFAAEQVEKGKGTQFNPLIADFALKVIKEKYNKN